YRVYGGLRFFERAEIKDTLAYLRLIQNPDDDSAFDRVANLPPRGIGLKTLEDLRVAARGEQTSLWRITRRQIDEGGLARRAAVALEGFLTLIGSLQEVATQLSLSELVSKILERSGLPDYYRQGKDGKGQDRIENLEELVNATDGFLVDGDEGPEGRLALFLAHAVLEAGDTQGKEDMDCVQLMTLHSAKGLEFPWVFLVGLEEGLFPHSLSKDDPAKLEEERRLCYVGMTRAMHHLHLSHAEKRRLYGSDRLCFPSRFLKEIPAESIKGKGVRQAIAPAARTVASGAGSGGLGMGQRVFHATFGEGVVLNTEGNGPQTRVQVNFGQAGIKWLMLSYTQLKLL
ncbi:MAG: 3'-5' exonuclease, partial [Pseudomonadota bacterium]